MHEGGADVVFNVNWCCTAETEGKQAWVAENTRVTLDPANPFTPYSDLTEEQVLSWVWRLVDKDATEAGAQARLNAVLNPVVVVHNLPWNKFVASVFDDSLLVSYVPGESTTDPIVITAEEPAADPIVNAGEDPQTPAQP
jgi:hypothetical protein